MNTQKVAKATALLLSAVSMVSAAAPMASMTVFAETTSEVQTKMDKLTLTAEANSKTITKAPKAEVFTLKASTVKGNYKYTYAVKAPGKTDYSTLESLTNKASYATSMTTYGEYSYKITMTNVDTGQKTEKTLVLTCEAPFADNATGIQDAAGNTYQVISAADRTLAITGIAKGKNNNGYDFEGLITVKNTSAATKDAFPEVSGYKITQFGDGTNPVTNLSGTPYAQINIPSTVTTIKAKSINDALIKVDTAKPGVIILGSTDMTDLYSSKLTTIGTIVNSNGTDGISNVKGVIFRTYHANVTGSKETRDATTLVSTPTVGSCGYTGQLPVGAVVEAPFGSWAFQCLVTAATTAKVVSTTASARSYTVNGVSGYDFSKGVVDKVTGKRMFWAVAFDNELATATTVPGYKILTENAGNPNHVSGTNILIPYDTAKKYIQRTVDFEYGSTYNQRRVDLIPRAKSGLKGTQWFRLDTAFSLSTSLAVNFTQLGLRDYSAATYANGKTVDTCTFPGLDRMYPVRQITGSFGSGYIATTDVTVSLNDGSSATDTVVTGTAYTGAGGNITVTVKTNNTDSGLFKGNQAVTTYLHAATKNETNPSNGFTTTGNIEKYLVRCKLDTTTNRYRDNSSGNRLRLSTAAMPSFAGARANHYYIVKVTDYETQEEYTLWDGIATNTRGFIPDVVAKGYSVPFQERHQYYVTIYEYAGYDASTNSKKILIDKTISYPHIYLSNVSSRMFYYRKNVRNSLDLDAPLIVTASNGTLTGAAVELDTIRFGILPTNTYEFYYDLYRQVGNATPTLVKETQPMSANETNQYVWATIKDNGGTDFNTNVTWWVHIKAKETGADGTVTWVQKPASRFAWDASAKCVDKAVAGSTEKVQMYKLVSYKPKGIELSSSAATVDAGTKVKLTIKPHDKAYTQSYIDLSSAKVQYRTSSTGAWSNLTKDANGKAIDFVDSNNCYVKPTVNGMIEYRIAYKYQGISTQYYSNSVVVSTGLVTSLTNLASVSTVGQYNGDMESRDGYVVTEATPTVAKVQTAYSTGNCRYFAIVDEMGTTKLTIRNKISTSPIDAWVKSKSSSVAPTNKAVAAQSFSLYKIGFGTNGKVNAVTALQPGDLGYNSLIDGKLSNGKSVVYDYNSAAVTLNLMTTSTQEDLGYYLLVSNSTVTNPVSAGDYTNLVQNKYYILHAKRGMYMPIFSKAVSDGVSSTSSDVVGATKSLVVNVSGFVDAAQTAYESTGFKKTGTKAQSYNLTNPNSTTLASMYRVFNPIAVLEVDVPGAGKKKIKMEVEASVIRTAFKENVETYVAKTDGTVDKGLYRYVLTDNTITGVQFVFNAATIQAALGAEGSTMKTGDTVKATLLIWGSASRDSNYCQKEAQCKTVEVTLTKR